MALATVDDVAVRLGRPITSDAEIAQVQAWIGDVTALILARIPDLEDRVGQGRPSAEVVAAVISNAVIRKVHNPEGKVAEDIDDYRYRYSETSRRGELFLTEEEWDLLLPYESDGAWTVMPGGSRRGRGQWLHPDVWVPLP